MNPEIKFNESLKIFSRTEKLEVVRDFILKAAEKAGFSGDDINKIILAVDEACTNIIKHAYKYSPLGLIEIKVKADAQKLSIIIKDYGESFEPEKVPAPDIEELVKNKKIGGLGMFLMKKLMDVVEYDISPGKNQLKLVKYLPDSKNNRGNG